MGEDTGEGGEKRKRGQKTEGEYMENISIEDLVIKIDNMEKRARNLSPVFRKISIDIKNQTMKNFRQEKDPDGNSWKKSRSGGKTLTKTSRLKHSIRPKSGEDYAMVGTNIKYAKIHQYGGKITAKNGKQLRFQYAKGKWASKKSVIIPKRTFIGISRKIKDRYEMSIGEYIKNNSQ
ncbi:phage virion morphogenesis protein [uncultured Ilyobacter sp.]|uniref:phage virion morphogenesis protein n=1 Tax=uncultured Ilyobacter sp. TaxID=544433 RepID=UPI0029F5BEB8|nr:phage virion morphogenesis protein [uncultured Ilyobacter sp.]